jgi:hypothetical protein
VDIAAFTLPSLRDRKTAKINQCLGNGLVRGTLKPNPFSLELGGNSNVRIYALELLL